MGDLKSRKAACKYNRGISPIYPLPGRKIRFPRRLRLWIDQYPIVQPLTSEELKLWSTLYQFSSKVFHPTVSQIPLVTRWTPFSKRAKFVTRPSHIPVAKFAQTQPVMIDAAFNNGEINPSSEKARGMVSRTSFDRWRGGFNCKEWASLSNSQGHDLRGKSRPISLSFGSVS